MNSDSLTLHPVGLIRRDAAVPEWFESGEVPVPCLEGDSLSFTIEGLEDDPAPEEFSRAIATFLELPPTFRDEASPHLFKVYQAHAKSLSPEEIGFTISSPPEVWHHVWFTNIHVSRRPRADKQVYVQITGNCDWDEEHGIQIVLREGGTLARVSDQDGHLTTADAYDLPESMNAITYE